MGAGIFSEVRGGSSLGRKEEGVGDGQGQNRRRPQTGKGPDLLPRRAQEVACASVRVCVCVRSCVEGRMKGVTLKGNADRCLCLELNLVGVLQARLHVWLLPLSLTLSSFTSPAPADGVGRSYERPM